jgi:NADH-ubiquinone oxidoreductase chain 5
MYLLLIFLPLLNSLNTGLFSNFIGRRGSVLISIVLMVITLILSFITFYEVGLLGSPNYITTFTWFDSELFFIHWSFFFDSLTVTMLIVVNFVSTLVHIYSIDYMRYDPHLPRFMSYLSLFTFFMLILVTANNFVQMFVGWEGVGLCSYLLINFWFTRIQANKASIKAMVINRIGDLFLAIGIITIFYIFHTVDYLITFSLVPFVLNTNIEFFLISINSLNLIGLFLFLGAVGKSAQLGLHTWLPDAMEGPTPVSALIHAATMVTAGVFLIARSSHILEFAPYSLIVITVVGAMTAFFAATTGLLQNDLKRVIAYSTCSQLGYMVFACGISSYPVGIFHLANHAFFKALLFLSAGSVIHAINNEQDMRRMGGLVHILPFTYSMILIGSLSLMGLPFLTGFYSKDLILEVVYTKYTSISHFAHWLGIIAAFFTAFYSIRLIYLTFLIKINSYKKTIENAHDAPFLLGLPLYLLSLCSIFIGYLIRDMLVGMGSDFWGNALFILPQNFILIESEFIPVSIKIIPVIFSLVGAFSAFYFYTNNKQLLFLFKLSSIGQNFYTFLNRKWFFDKVYNDIFVQNLLLLGYNTTYKLIDRGIIELSGPKGWSTLIYKQSYLFNKTQSGFIYHYAFIILISTLFFILIICLWNFISFSNSSYYILIYLLLILFFNLSSIQLFK